MTDDLPEPLPSLPQYGSPEIKTIHKPGILQKMMQKMMKLPKTPKAIKTPRTRIRAPKQQKKPRFY